ncbi:septal ring lytic transglycosylase RlpA family protein [Bosea thiooxidans]
MTRLGCVVLAGLFVANCAGNQTAGRRSKEIGAFPQSKYGAASPRVIADGEEVPKGGGRQLVGKAYSVAGKRYTPFEKPVGYTSVGTASWYGEAFHGRRTANGEVYDRNSISAAHPTMPLPAYARVTNLMNHRSIIVRVNDRGPFHGGRMMDLSQKTADALAFRHLGTARADGISRPGLARRFRRQSPPRQPADRWLAGADPGHQRTHHGRERGAGGAVALAFGRCRNATAGRGRAGFREPAARAGLRPAAAGPDHQPDRSGRREPRLGQLGTARRRAGAARAAAAEPPRSISTPSPTRRSRSGFPPCCARRCRRPAPPWRASSPHRRRGRPSASPRRIRSTS